MKNYSTETTQKEVTKIMYEYNLKNWGSPHADIYKTRQVGVNEGVNEVEAIIEHRAAGEGDKWFYDIIYADNTVERIFNPDKVFFKITDGEL